MTERKSSPPQPLPAPHLPPTRTPPRQRWAILLNANGGVRALGLLALMLLTGLWLGYQLPALDAGIHLTSAEVMTGEASADALAPATLASSTLPERWQPTALPRAPVRSRPLASMLAPGAPLSQVSWYRLTLPDLSQVAGPHFLYIPRWKCDGRIDIYGDGRLLHLDHSKSQWKGYERPLWVALDDAHGVAPPRTIVIRMQHRGGTGGTLSTLWVGNEQQIGWRFQLRDWLQWELPFMANATFLAIGLFALAIWLQRRQESLYLTFALLTGCIYIRGLYGFPGSQAFPVVDSPMAWIGFNAACWEVALLHRFFVQLHGRQQPWLGLSVGAVALIFGLLTLPVYSGGALAMAAVLAQVGIMLTADVVFLAALYQFWRTGQRIGMALAGWGLLTLQGGIHDALMRGNRISLEGLSLTPYANVLAFFLCATLMYRHFGKMQEQVTQSGIYLAQQLRLREAELTASHEQLRAIEQRELLGMERRRMTQDMHDGLGSTLVSALRVAEHGKLDAGTLSEVLRSCIDDLKLAIDSMEVVDTDLLLLLATLRFRLGPRLEHAGVTLRWEICEVPALDWLTPGNSLHILRILQEGIANILKHANASSITVSTCVKPEWVLVSIRNDGQGFDVAQARSSGGKGMANQLRRAHSIGALVDWRSDTGGSVLTLSLPLTQRGAVVPL